MMGHTLDRLGDAVPGECLQGLDDTRVEGTPPLLEQAAIGDLLGEGVREGIRWGALHEELVKEFPRLELRELLLQHLLGEPTYRPEQREGDLLADDACRLQQAFGRRWQPVDAGREHRLHGCRHR
jgi:hypothetical protein